MVRDVQDDAELRRVLALPRRQGSTDDLIDSLTKYLTKPHVCSPDCAGGVVRLLPLQTAILVEGYDHDGVFACAPIGSGKCVDGATEVFDTLSGRRRRVDEVGTLRVPVMLSEGKLSIADASAFASGRKECLSLRLKDGSMVVLSTDHPVYTQRGWVKAEDITLSDLVATPRVIPEPLTPTELSDDEVVLAALLLADGGVSQETTSFTNATPSVIAEFVRTAAAVCGGSRERKGSGLRSRAREFYAHKTKAFRNKLDLHGLAKAKRLHPSLWGLPNAQVALFLNRFWACDGWVAPHNIGVCLASEKMVDDLRFLLLRLGVQTRKRYKASRCAGKIFDAWALSVPVHSQESFLLRVGPILGKEVQCATFLRDWRSRDHNNSNVDIVPIGPSERREIAAELGGLSKAGPPYPKGCSRHNLCLLPSRVGRLFELGGQHVSRETFATMCRDLQYTGKYAWLSTTDLAWEHVESISVAGVRDVYDLTVPGVGNFVGNNIILHNTLASLLAAAVFGAKRPLLVIPGGLREKTVGDLRQYREHWDIRNIEIVSYEFLAREEHADFLLEWKPDLIVFDESQKAKDKKRSIARRVKRFVQAYPHVPIVVMSGTPAKRSIKDFAHTMRWALRDRTPLPLVESTLADWAAVVDAGVPWDQRLGAGALRVFGNHTQQIRKGLRDRIFSTPGALTSTASNVDAKLEITLRNVPLSQAEDLSYKGLYEDMVTPDGHTFTDAVELWRYARQFGRGYYSVWWNQKGFQECLTRILNGHELGSGSTTKPISPHQKKVGSMRLDAELGITPNVNLKISPTELRILRKFAHTTEREDALVRAVALVTSTSGMSSRTGTVSPRPPMSNFWQSTTALAMCAALCEPDRKVILCASTTTIPQEKSEAFSVGSVTERLGLWATLLRSSPALLSIFAEAVQAARPPDAWMEARKEWHAGVRQVLGKSRKLDTARQVASLVEANPKHPLYDVYARWVAIEPSFVPNPVPVWVGSTALDYAAAWAKGGGVVWCEHKPFGRKLAQMTGLPYFSEGGLTEDGRHSIRYYKGPAIIASIQACGTGFNLQHYDRGLITSMTPTATTWDQTLGRLHRQGQKSAVVRFDVMITCREDLAGFERAANEDAHFHHDLLAIPSRLIGQPTSSDKITQRGYAWGRLRRA